MPLLVVISGLPASGKTTLAKRLSEEFSVSLISKDTIKELLFETLPQKDREWSTIQGRAAIAMMYAGAKELLLSGTSVMIESSFDTALGAGDVDRLLADTNSALVEIHCTLAYDERQRRWTHRSKTSRHPGHLDEPSHVLSRSQAEDDRALYPDEALLVDTGQTENGYDETYASILTFLVKKGLKGN